MSLPALWKPGDGLCSAMLGGAEAMIVQLAHLHLLACLLGMIYWLKLFTHVKSTT